MKHWTPYQEAQLQHLMQAKDRAAALLRAEAGAVANAMIESYGYPADASGALAGIDAASLPVALLGHADALLALLAPQQARQAGHPRRSLGLPVGVTQRGQRFFARLKTGGKFLYGPRRDSAEDAHLDYVRLRAEHPSMTGAHLRKKPS